MRLYLLFLTVALLLGTGLLAHAAGGSWFVDANGSWSDPTKWTGGTVADGAGNSATFNVNITANRTTTLDSARTMGGARFRQLRKLYRHRPVVDHRWHQHSHPGQLRFISHHHLLAIALGRQ
jgi:hypothetical protein